MSTWRLLTKRATKQKKIKSLVSGIFLIAGIPLYAHVKTYGDTTACFPVHFHVTTNDSLYPIDIKSTTKTEKITAIDFQYPADPPQSFRQNHNEPEDVENLVNIETDYRKTGNNRKAFVRLLKSLRFKNSFGDKKNRRRLFHDLANVSARLKLYPLAMKCYYRTTQLDDEDSLQCHQSPFSSIEATNTKNSSVQMPALNTDYAIASESVVPGTSNDYNFLLVNPAYDHLLNIDTALAPHDVPGLIRESKPVAAADIQESFNDGKTAFAYALIVHVKQPVPGKRKAFTGINNVGHMFITLIKYNDDNSFASRSFGFYPDKTNSFSATPLHPGSSSVFKDDVMHNWDEVIGKFISYKRFQKILRLLKHYDNRKYNLNQNNCTDFGLGIATIGGIHIMDTHGNWPLGKGNNPANAGQSILEGKFSNTDTEDKALLFVCHSNSLDQR